MKCPFCGAENSKVIDSRPVDDNNSIRRRRQCEECNRRFTTYEKIELIPLMIVKKDDNREAYDRAKIELGIVRACHKRPVSTDTIKETIDGIEAKLFSMEEKEVPSSIIGEMVMDALMGIDEVAYVRFASIYREFRDVNSFLQELEKLYRK